MPKILNCDKCGKKLEITKVTKHPIYAEANLFAIVVQEAWENSLFELSLYPEKRNVYGFTLCNKCRKKLEKKLNKFCKNS